MSPIRTEEPVPPMVTWLAAVVLAPAPIAVEPKKPAEAAAPTAVAWLALVCALPPMAVERCPVAEAV